MPEVVYVHPHLLAKLHNELLTAFPTLAPTLHVEDAYGERRVKTGDRDDAGDWLYETLPAEDPNTLHLSWPDDAGVSEQQIAAIVNAHDPTPPPPLPTAAAVQDSLVAALQSATTVDQVKAALVQALGVMQLQAVPKAQEGP